MEVRSSKSVNNLLCGVNRMKGLKTTCYDITGLHIGVAISN